MNNQKEKTININWKPDKKSSVPVYQQILDYFNKKISSGDWPIGAKLPSQRCMAQQFNINRSTLAMAVNELSSYGILEGKVGKGTVIKSNTWSLMIPSTIESWGNYIQSGLFKENVPTIQTINKLEFDEDFVRLGTGELSPSLFPTEMMQKIMKSLSNQISSLNYLEPLGLLELREALSKRLKKKGINAEPSNILITSGSLQALHLISICMLKRGTEVFIEAPSYLKSLQLFQSAGMNLKGINMDSQGMQYWNIAFSKTHNNRVLYTIPTHHNPTGIVMSERRRWELYKYCSDSMLPIIEDDAYGELWYENQPPKSLKSLDKNGLVIYLNTISKSLAPGLRLGWLVGPESVVARLGDVKMQVDYGSSSVSQLILKKLLETNEYDRYLDDLRKILKRRRDLMLLLLDRYFSDLGYWKIPRGGFYIWLVLKKDLSIDKLFYDAVEEKLLFNPGHVYDFKKNKSIRLSFAYIEEYKIETSIKKLSDLIRKYIK